MKVYHSKFYDEQSGGSQRSAQIMVPAILDVIAPKSMIDVGCGVGYWPLAFRDHGVATVHGVDGPWADTPAQQLPSDQITFFDFGTAPAPFAVPTPQAKYDLVTSFEFIEHVAADRADAIADYLCALGDCLVIGGAIPLQGGIHHVNEQWPAYWARKFEERGFVACDFLRPMVWESAVEPWYAQNTIAYFRGEVPAAVARRAEDAWQAFAAAPRGLIHPGMWQMRRTKRTAGQKIRRLANKVLLK